MTPHRIFAAGTPEDFSQARRLFEDYQHFLGIDLGFQGFAAELDSLPRMYGPPRGALLLAQVDGGFVGCVGLRDWGENIAEMKRMYVLPSFRGQGIGSALTKRFIRVATDLNYEAVRLDTIPRLDRAISMYRNTGFKEITAYRHNPHPDALFFELRLSPNLKQGE
jgi:putative acetyltransferase